MRSAAGLAILIAAGAALGAGGRPVPPIPAARTKVVVELFTSEGCSSCPPADALLRHLIADQPVAGVEVVGLGDHVDYWDHLGWRDPFSSALFSQRQSAYARVFQSESVYTPQMVIDGVLQSSGNDEPGVLRNIAAASKAAKADVDVVLDLSGGTTVRVDVRVQAAPQVNRAGAADLELAIVEDGLVTRVSRGENQGRTLSHSAVARSLRTLARVPAGDRAFSGSFKTKLDGAWNPDRLHFIALLREQASHRILGAGIAAPAAGRQ